MAGKYIIVSAGHGDRDPGAVALDVIEHLHAYQIAWILRSHLEAKGHDVDFISCFQPLSAKIRNVNELHKAKPVDMAIEIHFNSAVNPDADGTEVLFYSPKLEPLAKQISGDVAAAIKTKDRGAKKRDNLGWLKQTAPSALIVEVCFVSSPDDRAAISEDGFHIRAAAGIAKGI